MTTLIRNLLVVATVLWLVTGCSLLPRPVPVATDQYVLEYAAAGKSLLPDAPVLIVTTPSAHGGYDTPRMAYMQQAYGLRYYTLSRWADTPARMLAPLLADWIAACRDPASGWQRQPIPARWRLQRLGVLPDHGVDHRGKGPRRRQ